MKRILLVDDEPDHAYVFTLLLERNGYNVDAFTDPMEALHKFKRGIYDLIILDYSLGSDLNGLEICKKIKTIDKRAVVILLTASHEQFQDKMDEVRKNFELVLQKPIPEPDLIQKICEVLP